MVKTSDVSVNLIRELIKDRTWEEVENMVYQLKKDGSVAESELLAYIADQF